MSGFNPKRLPIPRRTHFLSYPLYSPRSSLQLQNLLKRLRDDELALYCSQKAFRMPKALSLRIAHFNLQTQQTVEAASELLRNLDINRMLRNAKTAISNQNETATNVTVKEDGHEAGVPPLSVSLIGLSAGSLSDERLRRAHIILNDSTNRLHFLSAQINQRFVSEGFESTRTNDDFSLVRVINSQKACYRKTVDDHGARTSSRRRDSYDTRGLIEKYKDVVLAESIPLEKLSLCKADRIATFKGDRNQVLVDEYYEEVESIPLPQ